MNTIVDIINYGYDDYNDEDETQDYITWNIWMSTTQGDN
jgi:hypothetical protein